MEIIEGTFVDFLQHKNEGYFQITSDKMMNFQKWQAPIHWSGKVNGKPVNFIQITNKAISKNDFDFSSFTFDIEVSIPYIIEAINKKMRKMD